MTPAAELGRLVDRRPWAAHLYVTDRCNLDCHYCNEYDNSVPHPPLSDLLRWMRHIRALGVLRLGLQGGEPLMHPNIVDVVRRARELGFRRVSMSTNALLLTERRARELAGAGLDVVQYSVDRMTPTASTRKSLRSVAHKLGWFADTPTRVQVAGVLFEDTVDEMAEVVERCRAEGVEAHARVVHDDLVGGRAAARGPSVEPLLDFLDAEAERKLDGEEVHSSWNILDYQRAMLLGRHTEWTCAAGYKYFFVSAQGRFWPCSQVRTGIDIMDVTPELLRSYDQPKPCQSGCGVYCTVEMSLALSHPLRYAAREARGALRSRLRRALRRAGR